MVKYSDKKQNENDQKANQKQKKEYVLHKLNVFHKITVFKGEQNQLGKSKKRKKQLSRDRRGGKLVK